MRARVIFLALLVVGCGGGDLAADASIDADLTDGPCAGESCEPLEVVPTTWMVELEETQNLAHAVTVPGGFVLVGTTEMFRFTDDGQLTVRRDLPETWLNIESAISTPDGDVVLSVQISNPAVQTRIIRFDGVSLDEVGTYVLAEGEWPHVWTVGLADGRVVAMAVFVNLPLAETWSMHTIDALGVGEARTLGVEGGLISNWLARPDGSIVAGRLGPEGCQLWIVDVATASSTFTPLLERGCRDLAGSVSGGGLAFIVLRRTTTATENVVLTIIDTLGTVVLPPTDVWAPLAGTGQMIRDGRLAALSGGLIYHAPLGDLSAVEKLTLPYRPDGFRLIAVMASDDTRSFVAWLDQLSTFDTVLRVARLGPLP